MTFRISKTLRKTENVILVVVSNARRRLTQLPWASHAVRIGELKVDLVNKQEAIDSSLLAKNAVGFLFFRFIDFLASVFWRPMFFGKVGLGRCSSKRKGMYFFGL